MWHGSELSLHFPRHSLHVDHFQQGDWMWLSHFGE